MCILGCLIMFPFKKRGKVKMVSRKTARGTCIEWWEHSKEKNASVCLIGMNSVGTRGKLNGEGNSQGETGRITGNVLHLKGCVGFSNNQKQQRQN